MIENTDYTLSYPVDCTLVDTIEITITGSGGNFVGSTVATYDITARSLEESEVTIIGISDKTFTGSAITFTNLTMVVTSSSYAMIAGTDYNVVYSNNINAGLATVTFTMKGNYSGTINIDFNILAKTLEASMVSNIESRIGLR